MTTPGGTSTTPGRSQASAELQQLADALTQRGYDATVISPAPYLAVRAPGATHPHMIYSSGGNYWWHTAQQIAPTSQTTRAADLITWGLRNLTPHPAARRTGRGGGQPC